MRSLYEAGQVVVSPGRDPEKPVVRWAAGTELGRPGMLVKGSGVGPNHPDAVNSKKSGYKRRRGYRDAFELLIPDDTDPNVEMSLGWWVGQLKAAAEGGVVFIDYQCEECGHEGKVEGWKRPDPKAIQQILDRVVPKVQQHEVTGQIDHVLSQLDELTDIREVTVRTKDTKALPSREVIDG